MLTTLTTWLHQGRPTLTSWLHRRRRIARAQAEYHALADELIQLEKHIAAAGAGTRETLTTRADEHRRLMSTTWQIAFPPSDNAARRSGRLNPGL